MNPPSDGGGGGRELPSGYGILSGLGGVPEMEQGSLPLADGTAPASGDGVAARAARSDNDRPVLRTCANNLDRGFGGGPAQANPARR